MYLALPGGTLGKYPQAGFIQMPSTLPETQTEASL
jgi:hypothetical protein